MGERHNDHAGQGPVVLDIGGRIGALVVIAPADLTGVELEVRPTSRPVPAHLPHVAVVTRPTQDGPQPCAVFGELEEGSYDVYQRPAGWIGLPATVVGGQVSTVTWPRTAD